MSNNFTNEHEYAASNCPYVVVDGKLIHKVLGPYYDDKKGMIQGRCPACNGLVQRVWNLKTCGNCGSSISWNDLRIENYHDVM